jgi:hypothetical protein
MKKSFIFILLVLLVPLISAVQIDMKSNYTQGETLIAQVSGNFLTQIQQQNVLLYSGHVRVSFIPIVQKAGDIFYVYGQLDGKSPGNYSLVVSGVTYSESGKNNNSDIVQNFTIKNNSADFSITPGFVESNDAFIINAQNLADKSIIIGSFLKNSTPLTSTTTTQIGSGQTKQISFSFNSMDSNQLIFAVLQTNNTLYEIPVFIPANMSSENNSLPLLVFQPQQEYFSLTTNSNLSSYLSIFNSGQNQKINLSISDNLQPYVIIPFQIVAKSNSTALIPINITSRSAEAFIEGQITAVSPNSTAFFSLILNFSSSYVPPPNGTVLYQTCSQLSGTFCSDDKVCSVQTQKAKDGVCCSGTCQSINNNAAGKIIGWVLVAIVFLFVIFFLIRKYRKAKRPFNLLDFAKKK